MVSIGLLFLATFLGELRLLGYHRFFKFHHFLGMTTFYIVLLHFVSAIFEKFKWGKNLTITDYLGTNFSDKWMIALSIGSIAFYLIIIIGATSAYSVMRKIGYKRWKLIHFLSYLTLGFVFWHSIFLGTEFNHSDFKLYYFIVTVFIFSALLGLLTLRIAKVKFDTTHKKLGFAILIVIISGLITYSSVRVKTYAEELALLSSHDSEVFSQIEELTNSNAEIENLNLQLQEQIDKIKELSGTTSVAIGKAKSMGIQTTIDQPQAKPTSEEVPEELPIVKTLDPIIEEPINHTEDDDRYEEDDDGRRKPIR
ncbi:MAG: ferric reductase-like transmembrane domain-containing protein [Candidatus Gracilibacteria bacterium]